MRKELEECRACGSNEADIMNSFVRDYTFVTGEPALILSRKRGMARFPNNGVALRHDLSRR